VTLPTRACVLFQFLIYEKYLFKATHGFAAVCLGPIGFGAWYF
jgi:hypothetical protein